MPFLGVEPVQEFASVAKQTITGTGATSYSLNHSVASANDLAVFVNNVRQEPTSAYTASGGTITFTSALASTDSCYVMYIARTFSSATAEANSIGITELNVSEGTSGQALTTNGSGTLSFSTISSSTPTLDAVTGTGATTTNAITVGNLTSTGAATIHTIDITSAGGANNTGIGDGIFSNITSGSANTGVGDLALLQITTGYDNTAVGYQAMRNITTGYRNTAFGYLALYSETTNFYNTAIGDRVLKDNNGGYHNTGLGAQALINNTTGSYNTSIGSTTLGYAGGNYNTALGYNAGYNIGTGSNNTFIGNGASISSLGVSNEVTIGNNSVDTFRVPGVNFIIDASGTKIPDQLYFGSNLGDVISLYDDRLGDANMYGFGVESSALFSRSFSLFNWYVNQTNNGSSYAMQLNGNGRLTLKGSQSASNAAQVYFIDDASPGLVGGIEFTGSLGNGGNYNSSLQSSGELQYSAAGHFFADTSVVSSGIPGAWHRMNGDFRWGTYSGSTVITEAILMASSTGNLDIDGTLYQNSASTNSDQKMKENVVTLTNCLNKVSQLRGVEFDWKSEYRRDASHDIGVIAQEVEAVIPEIVNERELQVGIKGNDGETIKSVDYSKFTAVLIEAVKELKTQNEALEARIASLESN